MAFAIDPEGLQAHATTLRDLAGTTKTAKAHLDTYLDIAWYETTPIFAKASTAAAETRDAIKTLLDDLDKALTGSADELDLTAQRSIELDDAIEAELDAAYPDGAESGRGNSVPPLTNSSRPQPGDPSSQLISPSVAGGGSDLAATILTTDWLSPSSILMELINLLPFRPVDEVFQKFGGDWDKVEAISDALDGTCRYVRVQGDNISYAMATDGETWSGKASDAAAFFFGEMDKQLRDSAREIEKLSPEFATVALGMQSTASTVAGLFAQIMDAMLVAAISYSAAAATAATGVGAVIGFLAGTGSVAYILWLAKQAYEAIQTVLLIIDLLGTAVGVLQSFMIGSPELPKPTAYDNALV